MFSSSSVFHRNSTITRRTMMMMTGKLPFLSQGFFPSFPSSSLHQSLCMCQTINTDLSQNQETSEQRIARELESIAKKAIVQQSDSANFDNIINELKNSCSGTLDKEQPQDSSPSSLLKLELPDFSHRYRSGRVAFQKPPPVVLYDKYPLGDLLRYWFIYNEPYHHLGSDVHGINAFFRIITRGKICPLIDDTRKESYWDNSFTYSQMQRIADRVYPKVTIRDLAASKVSEAVPLRAFTLFDSFKNILTTDHSARIAQKNHIAPPGGWIMGTSLVKTYIRHWKHPNSCSYVFIVDGTAGSGKTIAALQMARERPCESRSPAKDIVIYLNVDDVYAQGKPWNEYGKAHLEELFRQHGARWNLRLSSWQCSDFLKRALVETFDRLLPPFHFKEDVNTEYRVVIVLDGMDRNFALRLQNDGGAKIVSVLEEKLFGPAPIASTDDSDCNRIYRVSFIVIAPSIDEVDSFWPFDPLSALIDLRRCCVKQSALDYFSSLKELQDENLKLAEALSCNARCAALLSSALRDSNTKKQLLEAKRRNSEKKNTSMKSLDALLKSIFLGVVREYIKRCGLSKFQHPEKAMLVALAISTFHVPILPRTLQHCPLLRKSLKLVGENDDDDGTESTMMTNATSLYDLLVEETRLLFDTNNYPANSFKFATSPAHLAVIHIIFGIPFSTPRFVNKLPSEKCFLISLVAPYFAEMKRALFREEFDHEVAPGQTVKECEDTTKDKVYVTDKNGWQWALSSWSRIIREKCTLEQYAFKEALVFDSIERKPSDVFTVENTFSMATEDIDDKEFEQRFEKVEKELTKKWSSSLRKSAFPVVIVCSSAENETFPQVAVVGPGKVVLAHEREGSSITTITVKADNDDLANDGSLKNLLASCSGEVSRSNRKRKSKQQRSNGAQIRYLKALQRIAKKLAWCLEEPRRGKYTLTA